MAKLTKKQEAFCHAVVKSDDSSKAYRSVYSCGKMKPETINREAHRLMQNHKVATRVQELRETLAERAMVTLSSLTTDLKNIVESACDVGSFSPAVAACGLLAKMHGLIDRPKEVEANQVRLTGLQMVSEFSPGTVPLSDNRTGPEIRGRLEPGDIH